MKFQTRLIAIVLTVKTSTLLLSLAVHRLLPSFDASPLLSSSSVESPSLRWDAIHFSNIARRGYLFEHELAFSPALPLLYRLNRPTLELVNLGTVVLSVLVFYALSRRVLSTDKHARLAAMLYVLSPHAVVSHSTVYTESFAALGINAGLLLYLRSNHALAVAALAFSVAFRPQAILTSCALYGALAWSALFVRKSFAKTLLWTCLAVLPAVPFLAYQYWVAKTVCAAIARPWCEATLPFSYGWIQSEYWNVGPFRYWQLAQLPNFLLASPVIAVSIASSYAYYKRNARHLVRSSFPFLVIPEPGAGAGESTTTSSSFYDPRNATFIHLHTASTLLLLTTAHVQIMLRVIALDLVPFWFLADNAKSKNGSARASAFWIAYWTWWYPVAVVLWTLFYPPA